jgi:hypothetical protein
MKLLSSCPSASMSMVGDERLKNLVRDLIREESVTHVIETGTYLGLGSTTFLAESFAENGFPETFITIEANWSSWRQARKNLARFPFVTPQWGKSVSTEEALSFIRTDEMLLNQKDYDEVYIDNTEDPVAFYSNEIMGKLGTESGGLIGSVWARLGQKLDLRFHYQGENLLRRYLSRFSSQKPLIVLDSAGGIGFLEFNIVQQIMTDKTYTILLDDVHHIKHYRSALSIRSDPSFRVIGSDQENGWMLAKHP